MPRAHRGTIAHATGHEASSGPSRSRQGSVGEAELWRDLRECALLLLAFHAGNVVAPIVGAFAQPDTTLR